jgi:hypothetical protein
MNVRRRVHLSTFLHRKMIGSRRSHVSDHGDVSRGGIWGRGGHSRLGKRGAGVPSSHLGHLGEVQGGAGGGGGRLDLTLITTAEPGCHDCDGSGRVVHSPILAALQRGPHLGTMCLSAGGWRANNGHPRLPTRPERDRRAKHEICWEPASRGPEPRLEGLGRPSPAPLEARGRWSAAGSLESLAMQVVRRK